MSPPIQRRTSLLRRWARLPVLLLHSLGWLSWVLLVVALIMQGTNYGQHELEGLLRRRLEKLGSSISLEGVRFDWLGLGLTVQELRVEREGREHLYLHNIYVSAHFSFAEGISLDRLDIDRGRLLISEQAIDDVRALINSNTGQRNQWPSRLPAVEIRAFEVNFEAPGRQAARLGQIELSMLSPERGYSRILGRVILPATPGDHPSPELFLSGLLDSAGLLKMHTVVEGFEFETWDLPRLPAFDLLRSLKPRGRVSLHTTGSLHLNGDLAARGDVKFRFERGSLQFPGTSEPLQALQVAFQAAYEPQADEDFWTAKAWNGGGQLRARWDHQQVLAGARLGRATRPGLVLESWVRTPDLLVNTPALAAMKAPQILPTLFSAIDPRGRVDARFALAVPVPTDQEQALGSTLEFLLRVDNREVLSAAYHGWPNPLTPEIEPLAFALPAQVDAAQVIYAHTPRFPRPDLLDVRFSGSHATGPLRGSVQSWPNPIDMPPFAQGYGLHESDTFVEVPRLELNQEIKQHLQGLYSLPKLVQVFDDYGIEGGTVGVDLRICSRMQSPMPALDVQVRVHDATATYVELPVPARHVEGLVQVVSGGFGKTSISFDVEGQTASAPHLRLTGRVRSEGLTPKAQVYPERFSNFQLDVESFDLQAADLDALSPKLPEVQAAVGEFAPRGKASIKLTRTSSHARSSSTWTEITPLGAEFSVLPLVFPVDSQNVRGRVLVNIESEGSLLSPGDCGPPVVRTRTLISPLVANWRGQVPIGFHAVFNSDSPSTGSVLGAALPIANRRLIRELLEASEIDSEEALADLQDVSTRGAIDFDYDFEQPTSGEEATSGYELHLRKLDLERPGEFQISNLRGDLTYAQETFHSPRLDFQLGGTPFQLTNVELLRKPTGFDVEADLGTRRLQITRPLVGQFLDQKTTQSLFEDFGMRGTLDVDAAHLSLALPDDAPMRVQVAGDFTLSDAFLSLGLPISVRSAKVKLKDLILEGEQLRGWMQIEDLYGQALGRDLAQTNMLVSYHGSQVTVEQFDGGFCRGTVRGLGADGSRDVAAPLLSVDLVPPYHFRAGLQLSNVDVRLLLEDVFASGIADRGLFDAHLQLAGDLENLLDIRGSGSGRVSHTILWSVPVLRDLFRQLGLDETAIFDSMQSDFEIADGQILMKGMQVHSPILILRGSGVMGLDGTLAHDLQVRYSLADKAGFFGDMIHWLQNRLLGISIRGDMSRPKVLLTGLFSNPFTDLDEAWRALPSPGYSTLPVRF